MSADLPEWEDVLKPSSAKPPVLALPRDARPPSRRRGKSVTVEPEIVEYTKPYLLAWNEFAKLYELPKRREVTKDDLPFLNEAIRMLESWDDFSSGVDGFREVLEIAAKSDWLMGRSGSFELSFMWLIKPGNFQDVASNKFRNRAISRTRPAATDDIRGAIRV